MEQARRADGGRIGDAPKRTTYIFSVRGTKASECSFALLLGEALHEVEDRALSSAPSSVRPSVVMSVSPTQAFSSGVSAGSRVMPCPTSMAPPS